MTESTEGQRISRLALAALLIGAETELYRSPSSPVSSSINPGKTLGGDLPDGGVVDRGVSVDQHIAESDDAWQIRDLLGGYGSIRAKRLSASPMISNWRSTAERSIGSSPT